MRMVIKAFAVSKISGKRQKCHKRKGSSVVTRDKGKRERWSTEGQRGKMGGIQKGLKQAKLVSGKPEGQ